MEYHTLFALGTCSLKNRGLVYAFSPGNTLQEYVAAVRDTRHDTKAVWALERIELVVLIDPELLYYFGGSLL